MRTMVENGASEICACGLKVQNYLATYFQFCQNFVNFRPFERVFFQTVISNSIFLLGVHGKAITDKLFEDIEVIVITSLKAVLICVLQRFCQFQVCKMENNYLTIEIDVAL